MDFVRDEYGKRALDFVEDMQTLNDYDSICRRISVELEWFGFSCVTVGDMPGPGVEPSDCIFMNTRPAEYQKHYLQQNYVARDPVMLALRTNFRPFAWNDVRQQKLSKEGRRIIDEGREFGARDGLLIPIFTASGSLSLFSPCGEDPNLSPRARCALEMIGVYSHQALQRALASGLRENAPAVPLTNREREVMKWVAAGKSDDEIASILAISKMTATTHFENAKLKLNATRRAQAVVQALRMGEITL